MPKLTIDRYWPPCGNGHHFMLTALLAGRKITVLDTLLEFNLMTPNARAAELRKAGWPVKAVEVPHPTLVGKNMTAYYFDPHFRNWWIKKAPGDRPVDYKFNDGRGKFQVHEEASYAATSSHPTGTVAAEARAA